MRRSRMVLACLLLACLVLPGCRDRAPAPQPRLRVGVIKALGTVTPYIARQLGYFAEAGLDVEIVDFQDGPTMMEAFVSGNIDITYGGIAPAAIWRAQGVKLKVVAATNSGGHLILVREDSGLSALADLKGKKVATPRTGSVTDTMFRGLVLRDLLGADPERDLAIFAGMAPADMPAALLLTREVDAIVTWEPFAAACLLQYGGARVLFSFPDYWHQTHGRDYPVNVVAAHEDLIRTRPQDLKRFLEIHVRTQRFINAEVDKANALIAAELGLEVPVIARARPNLGFTWEVEVEDCMVILGYAQALGYIKALPQAAELFDLSFLSGR